MSRITTHTFHFTDSRRLERIPDGSVALVVTSPPYPMIGIWDDAFTALTPAIGAALRGGDGRTAFELMHRELDKVWDQAYRILMDGGIACINVGDAARTVGGRFLLYPNHARILSHCHSIGFDTLPAILWRKQTNAPNKYMGSGMLPPSAYVTLEHEHILVLRKGGLRRFGSQTEKANRWESALFWEERNAWFSDLWDLKGVRQELASTTSRGRSCAFPFEVAFRLVNMFSVRGDTVLDPFLGTGTTCLAALASFRSSTGVEIDPGFRDGIERSMTESVPALNARLRDRLARHCEFLESRAASGREIGHVNDRFGFGVMTSQEKRLKLSLVERVEKCGEKPLRFRAAYRDLAETEDFRAADPATAVLGTEDLRNDGPRTGNLFES